MAKYSRYDSRNKKNGKHKNQSIDRDIRIKNLEKSKKIKMNVKEYYDKISLQDQEAS